MTHQHVIEIVIYTIKKDALEEYAQTIIREIQKMISQFEGFISFETSRDCKNPCVMMDLVYWDSYKNALNAALKFKEIQKGDQYKTYLSAFESVEVFKHFKPLIP